MTRAAIAPDSSPLSGEADAEAQHGEQGDDDQREQERVALVRGDLLVEGVGHGGPSAAVAVRRGVSSGTGRRSGPAPPRARHRRTRACEKPNGPAMRTFGIVAIEVL